MEESVLGLLKARKLLNVVNDKDINALIESHEIIEVFLEYRVGILYLEQVCRYVEHAQFGVQFLYLYTDGIYQVCLSHTR